MLLVVGSLIWLGALMWLLKLVNKPAPFVDTLRTEPEVTQTAGATTADSTQEISEADNTSPVAAVATEQTDTRLNTSSIEADTSTEEDSNEAVSDDSDAASGELSNNLPGADEPGAVQQSDAATTTGQTPALTDDQMITAPVAQADATEVETTEADDIRQPEARVSDAAPVISPDDDAPPGAESLAGPESGASVPTAASDTGDAGDQTAASGSDASDTGQSQTLQTRTGKFTIEPLNTDPVTAEPVAIVQSQLTEELVQKTNTKLDKNSTNVLTETAEDVEAPVVDDELRAQLMSQGLQIYNKYCALCHQEDGLGMGAFPAISGSAVATGSRKGHIDVVFDGVADTGMRGYADRLTDQDIAAVITYQRNALGNSTGDAVTAEMITAVREAAQ